MAKRKRLGSPPGEHASRRQGAAEELRRDMKKVRAALAKGDCATAHSYAFLAARRSGRLECEREGSGRARHRGPNITFWMMNKMWNRLEAKCLKR